MSKQLSKCKQGVKNKVVEIGGSDDTKRFLANIGLHKGDDIVIISKLASNYIINIKDGRFGIDKGIANLILVES